jgi:hypothetical protein
MIFLGHRLAPWRYKIVFDYVLLNHHHLSALLYPTLQTRIYLCITFLLHLMAISISLILDTTDSYLAQFTPGSRFLIFVFHSVNARFAGFQTIDINHFTSATLIIYLLLMITKPQMLCALSKSRFELIWVSLRQNHKAKEEHQQSSVLPNSADSAPVLRRRTSSTISNKAFVERHVSLYLIRQRLATKELMRKAEDSDDDNQNRRHVFRLHCCLFFLKFVHALFKHTMDNLKRTHTWLFIFIFLICAIEHERITVDPNITVFQIVFETVSAFGCVGLSLGYPGVSSSFATILSPVSRVIVGITMLIGRHRGLRASMKDQEKIEHRADYLLEKWKEKTIRQYDASVKDKVLITRFYIFCFLFIFPKNCCDPKLLII